MGKKEIKDESFHLSDHDHRSLQATKKFKEKSDYLVKVYNEYTAALQRSSQLQQEYKKAQSESDAAREELLLIVRAGEPITFTVKAYQFLA